MDELAPVILDDQNTPRKADEILFDIQSERESLPDGDEENEFTLLQEIDKHNPNNSYVSVDNDEIKLNHVIDSEKSDNVKISNVTAKEPAIEAESSSQYALNNSNRNGNTYLQTSMLGENDNQSESVESPDEIQVKISNETEEDFSNKCSEFSDILENKETHNANEDGFISIMTVSGENGKEEDRSTEVDNPNDLSLYPTVSSFNNPEMEAF